MATSVYQLRDVLYQGDRTSVFRGVRRTDGLPVVLKRLNPDLVGPGDIAQLRREFAITRRLAGPGIVRVLDFESDADGCSIVMADSGGVSLAQRCRDRPLTLAESLKVGAQVAAALARIHGGSIVHKDINPANIIWNDAADVVETIDFGIAAELASENAPTDVARLEGTLAYIAPEQTGRMNRSLDWRSDLYALGATLYDLLTGRPPFGGRDRLEVIHGHIARAPEPPHHLNPAIPPAISAIVLKLLAKEPEQRYQSARGVQADLEACLAALQAGELERLETFPLGRHDRSPRFLVPERLYGRDADIAALMASFERAAAGAAELLLVIGPAGIGKSALVQEIQKPLTGARGWFAEGKFDQFKRNIPYSALVQALNGLAGLLLAEPEEVLDQRRAALARAVGVNGRVVTELVPAFAVILGGQPPLPPVPPAENELRFQLTFQNLFIALATPDRPLVLFLDDLQWADRSSLALLGKLATDSDMRHLLVIGTSRPDSLEAGQPLEVLTGEIARAGGRVTTLAVGPLMPDDVAALVADTVHRDDEAARTLADLCHEKTEGNPFFLSQFLKSLHEDGLIFQDADGSWSWNPAQIAGRDSTDNVVDLMVAKLRRLTPASREAMSRAACIGSAFDLATLAAATGTSVARIGEELWPALLEGLILPLDRDYRTLLGSSHHDAGPQPADAEAVPAVRFRFLHDRVQQAAYALIAEEERAAVHLRLGRLLLAEVLDGQPGDSLFEILNHLNLGQELVVDPAERHRLIALNLEAARRAKAQAAFEPALGYARTGIALAEAAGAGVDGTILLALYDEAVTAACMAGDHDVMEIYAQALLARTSGGLEQAHAQAVRMTARLTRGEADEALAIGLAALQAVGIRVPRRVGRLRAAFERLHGAWLFRRHHSAPLEIPDDDRPTLFTTVCELLVSHISPIHTARPDLMLPLAVRLLEWSARTGDAGVQSIARTFWGMTCVTVGDLAGAARAFADTATMAAETPTLFGNTPQAVYIKLYINDQWSLPWIVQHDRSRLLSRQCLDRGDHEFGGYAAANAPWCAWLAGIDLTALEAELGDTLHLLERIGNRYNELHLRALWQAVANLRAGGERPARLDGAHLEQDKAFEAMRRTGLFTPLALASLAKLQLAVFFDAGGEARTALAEITATLDVDTAFKDGLLRPSFLFYRALALAGSPPDGGRDRITARLALTGAIRRFRRWTAWAPALHNHRLLLLRAEAARLGRQERRAAGLYEQAIAAAAKAGAVHEEALAAERAAAFHEECGATLAASALRVHARQAYRRWGAVAKARELERRFQELAPPPCAPASMGTDATGGAVSSVSTSIDDLADDRMDFVAVMTAARAISSEIRRETLLETLLRTVLHLAGAGRGLLLLQAGVGRLTLVAEADAIGGRFHLLPEPVAVAGQAVPGLPVSIVSYAVRTGEAVVLADASADPRFTDDPDIRARQPRSVLCLPLLHQGSLVGVLHLENNLATDSFVNQHLEAPRLLAAQIAISLENARLYDELSDFSRALEAQVGERTRALQVALDGEREAHEQLRAAQAQLVQAEKLVSLGQMMAGVAHEINTPLGIAITSASYLADETAKLKGLTVDGRLRRTDFEHYVATAEETTDLLLSNLRRTADLVHSFKQVAVDQASDDYRRFDLRDYLDDLLVSLGPVWKKGGHQVDVSCPEDIELHGYPGVLAQILTNLVVNSITHGYGEGRRGRMAITVTAPDANTVELVYTDDGRGISEEHQAKVFDPFFTTRRGAGSTGLGLHIVYNLVTAKLHGRIELDRAAGGGTRFVIQIPRVVPELVGQR
ncbi:MAG TPA: AAA family ATPase [Azospirillum sp.]|nr:AAA family ATPase [Azospirillum sp.]